MRHLAEVYEVYTVVCCHFILSVHFIYLFSRTSQQPARQKQSECETEKYHLTFSGAGTAHNLYCYV